ncbi:hypothetical protein GGH95_000212 [Coemansia sp. RSA 1836]|nr:hypothetical protein GGH95_000212 [Coemansia sp. RSA 1836]
MRQVIIEDIRMHGEHNIQSEQFLLDKARKRLNGVKSNLQFCQITASISNDSVKDVAVFGMILSLVCPRFTRLAVCGKVRRKYASYIREAITKEPFAKYANRLCRLAIDDPESGLQIS